MVGEKERINGGNLDELEGRINTKIEETEDQA